MNFYKRYPGDYLAKTRHLSLLEHGAYCLLLDWTYANGTPLPADPRELYRICSARTAVERRAVDAVLRSLWTPVEDGWINPRAEREIAAAQKRIGASRENGRTGGRTRQFAAKVAADLSGDVPRGTKPVGFPERNPPGSPEAAEKEPAGVPYQIPEPEKDKSIPAAPDGVPPSPPDRIFGFGLELLTAKGVAAKAARGTLGLLRKNLGDEAALALLERLQREDISDPVPWLMAACAVRQRSAGQGMTRADANRDYAQGVGHDGGF
jgi:uncharacterized protein YdaU (DUF1376 family)